MGGYQVPEKWLKDRLGRTLSYQDLVHYVVHYERTAAALTATRRLISEVDDAIEAHGGFPLG